MFPVREIITHTPLWVFALLTYLIWQGIRALRPQTATIRRILLVPALFLLSGIATLLLHRFGAEAWLFWAGGVLLLLPAGLLTGPGLLAVDPGAGLVRRAGSPLPLIRNLLVFCLQYGFAVMAASHPDGHSAAVLAARAVSGATSGYFLGWLLAMRRHYSVAPRRVLAVA